MYLSSFGHISATIPPMDLKPLSSASSDAVPCITGAITASLHHWKPYQDLLWSLCTITATTLGTVLLLAISQQPYHLWTSNRFHLHPLMPCHALQKRYQLHCTIGSHTKAYFGCY